MTEQQRFQLRRDIPVENGYDLLVAGGGPAGTVAAIAAAREGLRTVLVEATGALGGMGTSGLVSSWYCLGNNVHSMVGGVVVEICEALYERGAIEPGRGPEQWQRTKRGFGFDPEALKRLLDELCARAEVEVRFATRVIDAEVSEVKAGGETANRTVAGAVLHGIEGYSFVAAKAFIDATGDAVLAEQCGVVCRAAGRDTERIMPPTLCARVTGIDYDRFDRRRDQQTAVDTAVADGFFSQPDRHVPGIFRTGEHEGILNAGHLFGMDALSTQSLSHGYAQGRRLAEEYVRFFRNYLPGCEETHLSATAALMGVRESRRILGEYELSWDDFVARRTFPDQIGIYCKQVDVHVYDTTPEEYARFEREFTEAGRPADGEYYGMPYGILVPRGFTNLWAAGRCVSTDVRVNGSLRDQPGCMLLGQAAGTAAAQHVTTGEPACALNTRILVETLRTRGANLPQERLSETMSRCLPASEPSGMQAPPTPPGAERAR
ncbi:MAG: FAD-dependent oxidoreductase [Spirochaetaceae bacterium]|nr:MAG: FAD-dependent oxidoreductase [Spirochaetaceae bacterium]